MQQTRNTTYAITAPAATPTPIAPTAVAIPARKAARAAAARLAKAAKPRQALKPLSVKAALATATNRLMAQFVRDMQVARPRRGHPGDLPGHRPAIHPDPTY